MRVAIVHDDLVQWGGAERVLESICEVFPEAPIYTSLFDDSNKILNKKFGSKKINTSFLQKIPGWKNLYKAFLPIYPIAFEQFDFSNYDLVISQTTRFAKSIITKPETLHVCYCHTPPRFLWKFSGEKVPKILSPLLSYLRLFDQITSQRVDRWIAGSVNCQQRIKRIYHKDSKVLLPFIDLQRFANFKPFEGGYYLIISRLNPYKKIDIAIEVFNQLGRPLKIIGNGGQLNKLNRSAGKSIEFLCDVNEQLLTQIISGCKALIVVAEEDFGITPLEAQALGKPVIAFKKGGVLETVIENKTGVFFNNQTTESLKEAILRLDKINLNPQDSIKNSENFSKLIFQRNLKKILGV